MTVFRFLPRRRLQAFRRLTLLAAFLLFIPQIRAGDEKLPPLPKAFAKNTPETLEDLKEIQDHVKDVVKRVTPAVVGLQIGPAQGSGVIINKEGHVLTAGHVSGEPGRPAVIILPDGRRLKGKTLGANRGIDSGMVQITDEKELMDLPVVEMAKSAELVRGHWCLAIGHPGGWQKGRHPVVRLGRVLDSAASYIRTDCTLVGGDSGGPLFDMYGRVIGIHSRIGPTLTANVHVPVDTYRETWERLAAGEAWGGGLFGGKPGTGYLGLKLDAEGKGAVIDQVVDGSPAQKAGLKPGDVVTMLDSRRVTSSEELARYLSMMTSDSTIVIKIQRGDETLAFRFQLGRKPKEPKS